MPGGALGRRQAGQLDDEHAPLAGQIPDAERAPHGLHPFAADGETETEPGSVLAPLLEGVK